MMLPFYTEDCGLPKLAVPSDDATVQAAIPEGYALEQNHPNPFNPNTTITFAVPEASEVKLAIYNMTGLSSHATFRCHCSGSAQCGNGTAQIFERRKWRAELMSTSLRQKGLLLAGSLRR